MLDGRPRAPVLLHAPGIGRRAPSRHQGILGIVFKIPPAEGIPMDIHAWSQPQVGAEDLHFCAHNIPRFLNGLKIPGLRQQRGDGNGGRILIINRVCFFVCPQGTQQPFRHQQEFRS